MKQIISLSNLTMAFILVSLPVFSLAVPHRTAQEKALLVELTGKDVSKESDTTIYSEIVGTFQADDELGFKSRLQNLLTRFPQSPFADDALYLAGRMAMDHHNYAEALKHFSRIIKEYPNGNKVVSAKFAKAIAYKKMNLGSYAKGVLADVQKRYPGSPESFRAANELKLIK